MSLTWYPVIDREKCTQCEICVSFCSNKVFEVLEKHVVVKRPENCPEGCKGCESQCPVEAITHHGKALNSSSCSCGCSCSGDNDSCK